LVGVGFLMVTALAGGRASAQPATRPAVIVEAGAHTLWDEESFIGTGFAGGAGISVPVSPRLQVRGRVVRSRNRRDFGTGVVFERDATRYTADVLWNVTTGPRAVYVGGGAGVFAFEHESRFGPHPDDPRPVQNVQVFSRTGTESIVGGIAGVTAVSAGRFRLQPEVSIWLSRGYHLAIQAGVVAAWQW
jgi:hypothetical protein